MKFSTRGIHTRLYYVVKSAGGKDKKLRTLWLKNKFGFDEETIDLVFDYNIEELLAKNTIGEIKQLIIQKNEKEALKSRQAMQRLTGMLGMLHGLCDNPNIFHLDKFLR